MTECNQTLFPFEGHFSRQVVAQFEGSWLTSEGGSLLLRQVDRKINLLRRLAGCFTDYRQPERIAHRLEEMLAQRIYGLALGYEDLNDHEQLRQDPLLGVLAGKRDLSEPLAGKSTLNRLELTPAGSPAAERYNKIVYAPEAIDELLVTLFLESHRKAPQSIVLDLDATDTPLFTVFSPFTELTPKGKSVFVSFSRLSPGDTGSRAIAAARAGMVGGGRLNAIVKRHVVDINGIVDKPGSGGKLKEVEFTFQWDADSFPAAWQPCLQNRVQKAVAVLWLFDDGWRVKQVVDTDWK